MQRGRAARMSRDRAEEGRQYSFDRSLAEDYNTIVVSWYVREGTIAL